jgi:hypothetical protein
MKGLQSFLIVIAVVVLLLLATVATWTWLTIPHAPDPDTLPSQVLESPSAAYADVVEEGDAPSPAHSSPRRSCLASRWQ